MPELPEVETIRVGLARLLPGLTVKDVWHDWSKSFPNPPADVAKFLLRAKVEHVRRRAKVLIIELSSGYSLIVHLKMTGQLVFVASGDKKNQESRIKNQEKLNSRFCLLRRSSLGYEGRAIHNSPRRARFGGGHPTNSLISKLPDKSTRVILHLDNGAQLFFNDQRKFGWMRLLPTNQIPQIDFFKKLGPEPLEQDFTATDFIKCLSRRRGSSIKAVLLDQTVLAGGGNVYADESLFAARIHPTAVVKDVSRTELVTLYNELRTVLNLSIKKGGSTDRNYVNAEGKKGSYISFAQVFRREGQPCLRCGVTIVKIRVAGRGTHICPRCQKLPKT